jgi:hypothetical protein
MGKITHFSLVSPATGSGRPWLSICDQEFAASVVGAAASVVGAIAITGKLVSGNFWRPRDLSRLGKVF